MSSIQLITGSSGGMVGAAYIRELYEMKQKNPQINYYSNMYLNNMSRDILNPITFTIATTEWFFPFKRFIVNNNTYVKDRGFSFESKLSQNTNNVFDKSLGDYSKGESSASIPMMVFSPSIVNDGRKMLISPIGISYLTQNLETPKINYSKLYDAIDYLRFFEKQDASKTLFTSVLRMSATFPYISPIVSLPTEPRIEIMDAGLRDNYGLETTLRFINVFNDWIAENTSGIVIIQIRDKHKNIPIDDNPNQTLMEALSRPMGSFYINVQLRNELTNRISLSWHLTNKEKQKILRSISLPENTEAIDKIISFLKPS